MNRLRKGVQSVLRTFRDLCVHDYRIIVCKVLLYDRSIALSRYFVEHIESKKKTFVSV